MHDFHDDGDVNLRLNGYFEAFLRKLAFLLWPTPIGASLERAVHLLSLDATDVNFETVLGERVVHRLALLLPSLAHFRSHKMLLSYLFESELFNGLNEMCNRVIVKSKFSP